MQMIVVKKTDPQQISILRAERSITCLPFKKAFYEEIDKNPLSAAELFSKENWEQLLLVPIGPERAEKYFLWMIRLGILRREVDGQGLTSRIRLTPMGRKIILSWQGEIIRAGLMQRIFEKYRRFQGTL